jgi:hypothetical protein
MVERNFRRAALNRGVGAVNATAVISARSRSETFASPFAKEE